MHEQIQNNIDLIQGLSRKVQSQIMDHLRICVFLIDADCKVVFMNEFAQEFSGYSSDTFLGNTQIWEIFFNDAETGLRLRNICSTLMASKRGMMNKVMAIKTKAGLKKTIRWSMINIAEYKGKPCAAFFGVDGLELPFWLTSDASYVNKYRNIFKNAPIGFFRSMPEGRFLELNNTFASMLGFDSPEEVLRHVTDISEEVYFDSDFRKNVVDQVIQSDVVKTYETVFKNKNSGLFDVRLNISARFDSELNGTILEGTVEDISEKKTTERELHKNLKKYATLFEESPISMWEMDYSKVKSELDRINKTYGNLKTCFDQSPEKLDRCRSFVKIIDVNRATLELLGITNKEDLLKNPFNFMAVTNIENECESMMAFVNNKESFEHELEFKTQDDRKKNVIVRWVASPDSDLPYGRVLVNMIDITSHREEQDALHKNQAQLSSLLSSMNDLVFILDRHGKYEYVAPTRPELLISSAETLQGNYLHDFFEPDLNADFIDKISTCLQTNQTVSIDYPLQIQNKKHWFEAKISPLTQNSTIVVARDITERKTSDLVDDVMFNISKTVSTTDDLEELFEQIRTQISKLVDTKNFFLALFDPETNSLSLPYFRDEKDSFDHIPAAKTLSSMVISQKKSLLLHSREIDELVRLGKVDLIGTVAKAWLGIPLIVEGEVLGLMVLQNYTHEDAIREEHQHILEIISPQIGLIIKRKQSLRLLRSSEQKLRESNLTKDRFFNIIAHDLKNPFNAIIGFTSLLADEWNEFDDDDKISMINSIKSSSEGAYELLLNLLEWSRLHVGKMTLEPEFIDYTSLIRLNFSLLRSNAQRKNIKMIWKGICDKMVWGDPNMIKTVIRNLLTNAIKFTPEHGTISVECRKFDDYPGKIVLTISDDGVGIPEDSIEDIFSLTKSITTAGTGGESGTGLGLVLCKEFIDKNNGEIWVESVPNKGTTFFIALPVRPS